MTYRSSRIEEARAWLDEYFSEDDGRCEHQPNPNGSPIYHVPAWAGYHALWIEYIKSLAAAGLTNKQPVSLSTFSRAWKLHFSFVKTPAVERFSKCAECTAWSAIIKSGVDDQAKDKARADRDVHWKLVTRERQFLGNALWRSVVNPDRLLVIEIDGMDSAKTLLPHMCQMDKEMDKKLLLKYHLTCVKHNGTRPDDVYLYTNVLPHDASNTCTIIWMTLMKELELRKGNLPRSVWIQLDNTGRENKNKIVAGFCQWLVALGFVDEIRLSFLPVG